MKTIKHLFLAAACALLPLAASAQAFPSKAVTIVVPNQPGGAIDILARLLEKGLHETWKQPIIVQYKPGAGTVMGTDFVAKSPPDGHTIGLVITGHMINPSLRKNMPFDTVKDLSGVSLLAISPILISATNKLPANNVQELIDLAKKEPGKLTYASPGSGSSMHLAGELLKTRTGLDMSHVPYKGSAPAYPDVLAGRVPLMIDPLYSSRQYIDTGRLKPLAITSTRRAESAPDIPTVAETVPGFDVQSINGVVVPKATPRDVVHKLNGDFIAMLNLPAMRARLAELGLEVVTNSPEEFDDYIRSEIDKWAQVVKISGAQPE